MEEKIKLLLSEKLDQQRLINNLWSNIKNFDTISAYSEKMDRLEIEVELLKNLLK